LCLIRLFLFPLAPPAGGAGNQLELLSEIAKLKIDMPDEKLLNQKISEILKDFSQKLPHFSDGRINYSNSDKAPVIICFVRYKDKILLLKRGQKVRTYKGKWNAVAGYIDEFKPLQEKALEEIQEELGVLGEQVEFVSFAEPYEFRDDKINKTWIIFSVLTELKKEPKIKLDFEHTEYKWIKPEEITNFDIVANVDKSLKMVLNG